MKIENYIDLNGKVGISGLFFVAGNFGIVDGDVHYLQTESNGITSFLYENDTIRLQAEFTKETNGVVIRRDKVCNLSQKEIEIYSLVSRFTLTGNEYEIYTQYNGWQHESMGSWQKLVTQVGVAAQGIRGCDGATPMMGLHDLYTGKNTVFHLMPNAQWQMTVKKVPQHNDRERVVLETGFFDQALRFRVAPGETVELPAVIFFSAESKTDLDAYRLHETYHRLYPRKTLPILYNSWMYCYDKLDTENLIKQVDCAAELGFEGFMIDAGWFGNGEKWSTQVGDWVEKPDGGLTEISEHVREKGMIFGLWFEPERAADTSRAVAEHPEYYINGTLLDFANPDAVEFIFRVISEQIEKYRIGWVKFDFNASIPIDPSGNAFYRYLQGQKQFITRLREQYPDLYITNCASGGYRMDLGQGILFDSFWLSDNQGPYEGIRIVKDTLKRMPGAMIERWNVQKYCEGFPVYHGETETTGKMIHCNNGTWDFLIGINDSFSEEFLKGGPMGFSCDLDAFPSKYQNRWKEVIAQYKKDRNFYRDATARILVDSENITVIQYSDTSFSRCILQIFTKTIYANELVLYPTVDNTADYQYQNDILFGKEILEDGIRIEQLLQNSCKLIELRKCRKQSDQLVSAP